MSTTLAADVLIDRYVRLRDAIKAADDAHKKKLEKHRTMLEQLNGQLLELLNTAGGESIKTEHGTAYRTTKTSASLEDPSLFRDFVIANEMFDLADIKANAPAVATYNEEHKALPPGVKLTSVNLVGVRRS